MNLILAYPISALMQISARLCFRAYRLLDMDGNLWLMRMGGKSVFSVHALTPRNSGRLSLENVLTFSELGDSLTFDHLRPYAYSDIGSGLNICVFPINDKWRLTISGGHGFLYGERIMEPVMLDTCRTVRVWI